MAEGDRERWDEKYRGSWSHHDQPPHPFVLRALAELDDVPPGRALDVAGGTGRHAIALARAGWRTTVWDVSPVGMELLAANAAAAGVEIAHELLDLVPFSLPDRGEPFDLVLVSNFVERTIIAALPDLVVPGGHALVKGFTTSYEASRPPRRFRFESGELLRGLAGFETLLYDEHRGRVGLLARRES